MGQKEMNSKVVDRWSVKLVLDDGSIYAIEVEYEPELKDGFLTVNLGKGAIEVRNLRYVKRVVIDPVFKEDGTPLSMRDVADLIEGQADALGGDKDAYS